MVRYLAAVGNPCDRIFFAFYVFAGFLFSKPIGNNKGYFSRGGEIGHGNKGSYEPLILPSVQTDP